MNGAEHIIDALFPLNTGVNSDGHLEVGGCDLVELASECGTPTYVYDEHTIRSMCRSFVSAFNAASGKSRVSYSTKAADNPHILRVIADEGLGMDVCTGGQLSFAKFARVPAKSLNFHGNNKSTKELGEALDYGVSTITIDSLAEIERLRNVAHEKQIQQQVMVRVSPEVDPRTHRLTATGALDSKFGFSIRTGAAKQAMLSVLSAPELNLVGLHFHLGSPLFEIEPYEEAIEYVLGFATAMKEYGFTLQEFNSGGGFAAGYVTTEPPPSIEDYAKRITGAVTKGCADNGLDLPAVVVEPGRAIVARAGIALYSVGGVKDIPGVRRFLSVDGGMGDNIRPAIYNAQYSGVSADKPSATHDIKTTVAGKYCESGDLLLKDAFLPEHFSLLAIASAGAYCLSMSSNYLQEPRPAVVMVNNGSARLIRRRETYDDLLASSAL